MGERESGGPNFDTQPMPFLIENESFSLLVSFNRDFNPLVKSVILGILADKKDREISEEAGVATGKVRWAMKSLKKGVVKRGHQYPYDRQAMVYALIGLGDIAVEKVAKKTT